MTGPPQEQCISMAASDPEPTFLLTDLFGRLRSPVYSGHTYFVENPPERLDLNADQLRALEVREPFFVGNGWSMGPNRAVVPFVWDPQSGRQARFSEAESYTDYDSGHLGLVAVSAPTGETQAKLYVLVARAILDVHRANRALLGEWFDGQVGGSADVFQYFDNERQPPVEKLLNAEGVVDRDLWDRRIDELSAGLDVGAFKPHYFRWFEFLAHAVDIPQLMQLIRAAA
jgi:hypothetical protein